MSMAHLSDQDFVAYVERNAKGQPPWQFIPPDDVLRLTALLRAAWARVEEQQKIIEALDVFGKAQQEKIWQLESEKQL